MPHILSRFRFSPYFLLSFIGATLPHRVTIGQIAPVGFLFSFVITPMPVKKLEARLSNSRDSFLINLNWVKATAEFFIRNPTWIFPII